MLDVSPHTVRTEALSTLTQLVAGDKTREHRLTTLLRIPEDANEDWFIHVPIYFNNALDIRRTIRVGAARPVWTQGANFSFSSGDTLYDTAQAYDCWSEALLQIRYSFHVSQAIAVSPPTNGAARRPGSVTFTVSTPNEPRTALSHVRTSTVTQDEFVRLLISGFSAGLSLG